jgi:pimeloyl-ACP methyl ester carboxylesterase
MLGRSKPWAGFVGIVWLAAASWRPVNSSSLAPAVEEPGCAIEQVALHTADGVILDGIAYQPTASRRATAILLVHGFGGNFYSEYFPTLARMAAKQGYATLALNMRDHDGGPKVSDFADNEADIAAGTAYLRSLGYSKLVLLGQSMGTNRVLYYEAVTSDPAIAATVLVSGPGNLFEWNVWQFGRPKAQASVDEALALQAAGQEQQLMVIELGPLGKALYTARYLLSLRGPASHSDPYQNVRKVTNRVLILQGSADKLVEPGVARRLQQAATVSAKAELISMEGAGHSFRGREGELAQRVLEWLNQVTH